ncbi:MAG: VCBS repeat-containing protein, partial [Bacteroidota bacterium]
DDLIALDMFPEDNPRRKAMMPPNNYTAYLNNDRFGYLYQFTRNNLQLRQGNAPDGTPVFAEVGMQAGVAATDWSWSPLAADFDNDGDHDLLITNGFPKDVTDRDFMDYNIQLGNLAPKDMLLAQIPSVKINNYAYENTGGEIPIFRKQTVAWGLDRPSFSNGAVFADLDDDGDLDYVVNNINETCFLYENTTSGKPNRNWLKIKLIGPKGNPQAVGARVTLDGENGDRQTVYQHSVRGYLSSVPHVLHFGLGARPQVPSLLVRWPDGSVESFSGLELNAQNDLTYGTGAPAPTQTDVAPTPLLREDSQVLASMGRHRDSLFIDFNVQPLLPHKLSEYGPGLAVGDIDGDGLYDLYRSGSHFYPGELLRQTIAPDGTVSFVPTAGLSGKDAAQEELGGLFFDADGDGDQDLYLVSGGSERGMDNPEYFDRLFLNDGTGNFSLGAGMVPQLSSSGSCVRAADYDQDGDLDLFVGGRLRAGYFPQAVDSYLLDNDGKGNFSVAKIPALEKIGLVCDALWTDYDADGWTDLLLAGQGIPLTFLRNDEGQLQPVEVSGLADHTGWWNGLTAADFDRDGDLDYAAANFGHNHLYRQNGKDYVALY